MRDQIKNDNIWKTKLRKEASIRDYFENEDM